MGNTSLQNEIPWLELASNKYETNFSMQRLYIQISFKRGVVT